MCLIVSKNDATAHFTNRQFKLMLANNPHGLGMMWRENGRVIVQKSIGSEEEKFKIFKENRDRDLWAMHARVRTHGLIDEANCHPYEIFNIDKGDPFDLYVMHNGVLSDAPELDKDKSDTWHYMEYIIKPLLKADPDVIWDSPYVQNMLIKAIGTNKLLFMRSDDVKNPVLILNYKVGEEKNGCWLSNNYGCREYSISHTGTVTTYGSGYNYKTHHWDSQLKRYVSNDQEKKTHIITTIESSSGSGSSRTPKESDFDIYGNLIDNYHEKEFEPHGQLYLPKASDDDKIVHLTPKKSSSLRLDCDENLLWVIDLLRSQGDGEIKAFIRDDPDTTADIILGCYSRVPPNMDYETITKLINHPKGLDDMVNLIRCLIADRETSVKGASRL